MKILKKIFKIFFDILVVLAILLAIIVMYNFVQVSAFNKKYPEFFGYTFFEVTTGSMKETIQINDVILVKITNEVKEGDIISYENGEEIITHRIVEEKGEQLITKGDANTSKDKPIERNSVIGKVVKTIPKLGIWLKVFSDIKVIFSISITIILFGLALSNKPKEESKKSRHSFSKFIKNVKGIRKNAKSKETKE